MKLQTFACTLAGLASLPSAIAWGAAGHEIVATIAQIHLDPSVLPVLCDILYPPSSSSHKASTSSAYPPCHLAPIAAWADRVRGSPAYRWTAPLHYVGAVDDAPADSCAFPGPNGWAGRHNINVLAAVSNKTGQVAAFLSGEAGLHEGEEALKYLVHFMGDMHMPLHLTGKERGGNGAKVTFDGRVSNLHSVWDNLLIAQALRTVPPNYTWPLPDMRGVEAHLRGAIYDPYIRRIIYEGFGTDAVAGRFTDVEEWLDCPADDSDAGGKWLPDTASASASAFTAQHPSLSLKRNAGIRKRHRASRPKFAPAKRDVWAWAWVREALARVWRGGHDEERWDTDALCPYAWAREIHRLNCALPVWPAELSVAAEDGADTHGCAHGENVDGSEEGAELAGHPRPHPDLLELDTPAYAGKIRAEWVVERLLAMAGVRLAAVLNTLVLGGEAGLAPPGGVELA
ncbi:hypothetical protein IEO21_08995 [Rhodonia placenta]|uniref:Phospholipase C/P1 nuclease n=1 Tax=Rhodonia placenta TaxID=104341 RepID=A0A8H7NVD2_9APHY|nr:hypothetical protein IEO21_08995 [Postia placenta]